MIFAAFVLWVADVSGVLHGVLEFGATAKKNYMGGKCRYLLVEEQEGRSTGTCIEPSIDSGFSEAFFQHWESMLQLDTTKTTIATGKGTRFMHVQGRSDLRG